VIAAEEALGAFRRVVAVHTFLELLGHCHEATALRYYVRDAFGYEELNRR
jgi:hypothetical protein